MHNMTVTALFMAALIGATCVQAASSVWTNIVAFHKNQCVGTERSGRWPLCTVSFIQQISPAPDGGPQALEGYTAVTHSTGVVASAIGTIGNMELSGASGTLTKRAIALTGGVVVGGAGVVDHVASLQLSAPKRHGSYNGPMNIKRADYISFDNGWSIRPAGPDLLLCDPAEVCRRF